MCSMLLTLLDLLLSSFSSPYQTSFLINEAAQVAYAVSEAIARDTCYLLILELFTTSPSIEADKIFQVGRGHYMIKSRHLRNPKLLVPSYIHRDVP